MTNNEKECVCDNRGWWSYPYGREDFIRFWFRLVFLGCAFLLPFIVVTSKDLLADPIIQLGLVISLGCYIVLLVSVVHRARKNHKLKCAVRYALLRML